MSSSDYDALLNATIEHLKQLKESGVQFIRVDSETLKSLSMPAARPKPAKPVQAPAPAPKPPVKAAIKPLVPAAPFVMPTISKVSLSPEERVVAMEELRGQVLQCIKCPNLAAARKNVVFGVGNINTELMFVGEAPGADEDLQGEPFVGKAGQLLTRIIQAMGYARDEVYIANILKCRPDTPGQLYGNRKPTPDEMKTCVSYLLRQIEIVQPRVIVALGATAVEGLLGTTTGIMRLRGNWQSFQGIPVMPTYHPAYLLRNQLITEKRKVWEDMLKVLEKLNRPITEKQRNYFRKA